MKTYDPSGDSTLPTCSKKRKIEQVDKEDEIIEKKAKKAKVKIKGQFEFFKCCLYLYSLRKTDFVSLGVVHAIKLYC